MLELMDMRESGRLKDDTPIANEDGIGGGADCLISLADEMLGGIFLTPRQQAYLRVLGYTGTLYMSQDECSHRIETLRIKGSKAENVDFDEEVDRAIRNQDQYVRSALIDFGKGKRFRTKTLHSGPSLLILLLLPFRVIWVIVKTASRGAVVASQHGAKFAKNTATKTAEFEKKHKFLQITAIRFLNGAKKSVSMLTNSLGFEQEQPFRTWTSSDGKHTTEARLVSVENDVVRLQKTDGSVIEVPKTQLCQADIMAISENDT